MKRSLAKYLAGLAVMAALFDWETLLTRQFTLLAGPESTNYTYSWLHFWINSLRHAHLPLWDPYVFCGRPFAGEMLPSAYYPIHLLLLLVPFNRNGLFSPALYNAIFFFNHLLSLYFTFALIRELRLSRFAALVGACCFSLSGLLAYMPWLAFVEAAIWLPAIFLFLLRALRAEERPRALLEAALSGLCLGMSILTGGLHFSMMQGVFVLAAILYYGAANPVNRDRGAHWRRALLILGVIVGVSLAAGAVQLLPAFEYSQLSLRYIDGGAFAANKKIPYDRLHPGMWPQSIALLLFPTAYSGHIGGGEIWASYVGVFPFFLAVTAIWKCWNRPWVRLLTGMAVLAFVYTWREFSPLHGWLYALVPYLWVIRQPARFVYLVSFALAILAAFGIEVLLDGGAWQDSWKPARQVLKWVAIACAGVLFVAGIFQIDLNIWICLSLLLVLGSCGWFFYLAANRAGTFARVLLAGFILFDLTAFHWNAISRAAPSNPDQLSNEMISLKGVARFLNARPELARVRVDVSPDPNIGDVYGVQSVSGGGGTILTSYSRLYLQQDLLNVRYVVKPASVSDPGPVYQDTRWKVYESLNAYPRAWLVHKTVVENSQEAVWQRIGDPAINLREVALLEAPLSHAVQETTAIESVRFLSYEPDRMAVEVAADRPGLLVLSEMYYPGWSAAVNGTPSLIHRVDGGLRGIVVPRGRSRIELTYAPVRFYVGGALGLFAFGVVLTASVVRRRAHSGETERFQEADTARYSEINPNTLEA
jgi:hypothetical protein